MVPIIHLKTAGNETTLMQIAKMTKRGGTITLVGYTAKRYGKVECKLDN